MTEQGYQGECNARPAPDATVEDTERFRAVMSTLRMRRKLFFGVVIGYMPLMWLVHRLSPTFRSMAITFGVWVAILFVAALYSAVARCPRCGQYFHMHGMSLMYLRRCLHCQLHISGTN